MIIRKITEVTETQTTETFQLICDEKDEGWELTREEMEKLRVMTEKSLEGFHIRRQNELLRELSNLNEEFQSKAGQIDKLSEFILTNIPGEPSRNEGAVDTAIRLLKERQNPDQAEECPDYIEPPAPEVVCENGVCQLILPEEEEIPEPAAEVTESSENLTKTEEKVLKGVKNALKDWQKYIDMGNSGAGKDEIKKTLMADKDCRASVAGIYYARYILPHVNPVKVLEPVDTTPQPGKYFTEEERLRIQKKLGLK